jgi:ABC-type transporter Mla subunit MlaD
VALFGRGKTEPVSIESEQERLYAIRIAAEQELGRLRRELTERVAAVEQRERELADAITHVNRSAGRAATGYGDAVDLARRAAAAAETPEERLAHIEERIAALHEAETAFARTQAELAARSAELATREAALAENARLGVVDAGPVIPSRAEMDELDERLRRLERETREATKEHGFGDSLRALESRGLRGGPPSA